MTPACPFCGEPAQGATRFKGVYRCGRHGGFEWFSRESLDDIDLIAIYQSYGYNRSVRRDFARMKPAYIRGLRRRVLKYHPRTEGLSFLDVGCANGEFLEAALALGMGPVDGVEVDEEAKTRATAYGRVYSSMDELHGQYDIVQCKNVLSNIPDFQVFFERLLETTKPGGVMFLDVLNQFGFVSRVNKLRGKPGSLRPPFVINGFSKRAVTGLAGRNGARLAWMGTTYVGSDLLPYRKNPGLVLRGRITRIMGAASMIAADIVRGDPDR